MKPFREHHLFQILNQFSEQRLPLDLFLRNYFRAHKAAGSKDRKEICHFVYLLIRHRSLLDAVSDQPSWQARYLALKQYDLKALSSRPEIPPHIRVSFPKAFYALLCKSLGEEKALNFCQVSNETAPTTIRVNTRLSTRDALFEKWRSHYPISLCQSAETGISFQEKINFFGMEEFKAGLFEVQDEGSQLVAGQVQIKPGELFLDYCAGSGGKTLAIAPQTQDKGQLFLHDIRPHALKEAKKRLKRAGIQNAQILLSSSNQKHSLLNRMDWVLVDAPCSGTGTLRRNPDMKWRFEEDALNRLLVEQRAIVKEALQYLKPEGRLVYATCSVLPQENEEQSLYFQKEFNLEPVAPPLSTFPKKGQMDGFFAVVYKQKKTHTACRRDL